MGIALTLLLVVFPVANDDRGVIEIHSYALGKHYIVAVTQKQLDKSPIWKDDAENPPLSARKAMKLTATMKDNLVKDTDRLVWKQEGASLEEAGDNRWYWLISYRASDPRPGTGSTGQPPTLRLIVLMDGTVIEPQVSKDK
jgi:hypothetical protein